MFRFDADLRIYLHREPIDFRAGINSLVTLVEQSMQLDPLARAVYAYRQSSPRFCPHPPRSNDTVRSLLVRADNSLYATKRKGRNAIEVALQ